MTSIHDEVEEFKRQARPLLALNDQAALRELFARWVVYVRARSDDELSTVSAMREALKELFLEPSRRAREGWFDDLDF